MNNPRFGFPSSAPRPRNRFGKQDSVNGEAAPPMTWRQEGIAYAGIIKVQIRTQLIYRADFLFGLIGILTQIYLLKLVWTAVFPDSGSAAGSDGSRITLSTQIAYATLAMLQYWLFNPSRLSLIPDRIRQGSVVIDLVRPISFTSQMFFSQVGTTFAMVPFAVIALPFAVLIGGMQPPASAGAACAYLISLVPAYLITVLLSETVSMVAFWTMEIGGIFFIYRMVSQLLSGTLVPLWFMPDWLATQIQWLPFHATIYTPLSIYLGQISGPGETLTALGVQCAWVAVLWLVLRCVWLRAMRQVVIQGG
ncbi:MULTISPECIES: ABC transporter permease [unclassified Streptomyces]|uniref:ABC transporter permease n=1 Tax=Streptomyces sp. NPDC127532 TaxID=3345399 RepID=UPI00363BDA42